MDLKAQGQTEAARAKTAMAAARAISMGSQLDASNSERPTIVIDSREFFGVSDTDNRDECVMIIIEAFSVTILSAKLDQRFELSRQIYINLANLACHECANSSSLNGHEYGLHQDDMNGFSHQSGVIESGASSHNLNDKTQVGGRRRLGRATDNYQAKRLDENRMDCSCWLHGAILDLINKARRHLISSQPFASIAIVDNCTETERLSHQMKENCDHAKRDKAKTALEISCRAGKSDRASSLPANATHGGPHEPLIQLAVLIPMPTATVIQRPLRLAGAKTTTSETHKQVVASKLGGSMRPRRRAIGMAAATTTTTAKKKTRPRNIRSSTTREIDLQCGPSKRYYRQVDRNGHGDGVDLPNALATRATSGQCLARAELRNSSWPAGAHRGFGRVEPQNNEQFGGASGKRFVRQQRQPGRRLSKQQQRWSRSTRLSSKRSIEEEEEEEEEVGVYPHSMELCNGASKDDTDHQLDYGDGDDDHNHNHEDNDDDERKMNPLQAIRVATKAGSCGGSISGCGAGDRARRAMGTYDTRLRVVAAATESLRVQIDRPRRFQRQLNACSELRQRAPSGPSDLPRQLSSSGEGAVASCFSCPLTLARSLLLLLLLLLLAPDSTNMGLACEATRLEPVAEVERRHKYATTRAKLVNGLPLAKSRTSSNFFSSHTKGSGRQDLLFGARLEPALPLETKARKMLTSGPCRRRTRCCLLGSEIVTTRTSGYNQIVVNKRVGRRNHRPGPQCRVLANKTLAADVRQNDERINSTGSSACLLSICCFLLLDIIMQTENNWMLHSVVLPLLLLLLATVIATCRHPLIIPPFILPPPEQTTATTTTATTTIGCGESNRRRGQCYGKSKPTSAERRDKLNQMTTRGPRVECDLFGSSRAHSNRCSSDTMFATRLSSSCWTIGWLKEKLTAVMGIGTCTGDQLESVPPISRLASRSSDKRGNANCNDNSSSDDNQFTGAANRGDSKQEVKLQQCQWPEDTFAAEEEVVARRTSGFVNLSRRQSEFGQCPALLTILLVVSLAASLTCAGGTSALSTQRHWSSPERQLVDSSILFRRLAQYGRPHVEVTAAATVSAAVASKPHIHSKNRGRQRQWHSINESLSAPVDHHFGWAEGDNKGHRRRKRSTIIDYGQWQTTRAGGAVDGQDPARLRGNNLSPLAAPVERGADNLVVQPNVSGGATTKRRCSQASGHCKPDRAIRRFAGKPKSSKNNRVPQSRRPRQMLRVTSRTELTTPRSFPTSRVKQARDSGGANNHKSPVTIQRPAKLFARQHRAATRRDDARAGRPVDHNKDINYQPLSPWSFINNVEEEDDDYGDDDDNSIKHKTSSRVEREVVKVAGRGGQSAAAARQQDLGDGAAKTGSGVELGRRSPSAVVGSFNENDKPSGSAQVQFGWCFVFNSISRAESAGSLCNKQWAAKSAVHNELDHHSEGRGHSQLPATAAATTVSRPSWLAYCSINVADGGEMAPVGRDTHPDDVICCCAKPPIAGQPLAYETPIGRLSVSGPRQETLNEEDRKDNTSGRNETSDIESVIDEPDRVSRLPDNSNAAPVSTSNESSFGNTLVGSYTNRSALDELLPSAASFKWTQYQEDDETTVNSGNFDTFREFSNTNFISSEGDQQLEAISLAAKTEATATTTTSSSSLLTYDNRPSVISHIGTQHDSISITSAISEYIGDMIDKGYLLLLGLSLIILVTFFGNVLVCLSVIIVRKLRQPSNYLLVSLAISDLCVACFVMPFGVYVSINDNWRLGTWLCNVYVVSDITSCTASILNLCVISIDRYFAITRPLTYCIKRTARLMLMLIAFVWILAFLISVPPLLISGNEYGTVDEPRCEPSQSVWYQLYATLFSFYIPLCVMIFIYYNIYTAAKKVIKAEQRATTGLQVNNTLNFQNNINENNNSTNNNLNINCQNNVNADSATSSSNMSTLATKTSSVMKERKASITLGFIMSAFTICWLPFFIIAIMRPFSPTINNLPRAFVLLTLWLGYANSLLNPIIYVTFHHDFRNAFKHLLCFRCMTINEQIRKDEYESQYGETHYQENIRKLRGRQYMLPQNQQQHQFNQNQQPQNQHQVQLLPKKN